jgi:hypothetical protein
MNSPLSGCILDFLNYRHVHKWKDVDGKGRLAKKTFAREQTAPAIAFSALSGLTKKNYLQGLPTIDH